MGGSRKMDRIGKGSSKAVLSLGRAAGVVQSVGDRLRSWTPTRHPPLQRDFTALSTGDEGVPETVFIPTADALSILSQSPKASADTDQTNDHSRRPVLAALTHRCFEELDAMH